MSPYLTAVTGVDALIQAIEAYTSLILIRLVMHWC